MVIVVGQASQRSVYAALECPDIKDEGVHQRHLVVATQVFHLVHHGRDLQEVSVVVILFRQVGFVTKPFDEHVRLFFANYGISVNAHSVKE